MSPEPHRRRILLVTNDLGPRAGGIETFILGLLDYIDGSQCVIYTSSQEDSADFDKKLSERTGVVVIRDKSKVLLPSPRVNREVSAVLACYGCESVWFGAAMPLAWMSHRLRKRGAKNIVAITHGHEVWWATLPPFSWIFHQATKSLDTLTYLGDFTKSAISPIVDSHCTMVQIAPGIPINHFTPGAKSPELLARFDLADKKVIVCVGRLVHRKGQDKLIEALPQVIRNHPDAVLLLVGIGPREEHCRKLVASLGLTNHVRFVGRVAYAELPEYFRLGDIFAMPSRSRLGGLEVEGLGIVYLEASACAIPVLAGASGGAPDAVLNGETGEVVNGESVVAISNALNQMLSDMPRLRAMGQAGRAWAESAWSWEIWGKKFAALLSMK